VRRRLAQKLEFLSQDLLAPPAPDEEELQAWFAANAERYREPALVTFSHVFVDPDRREDRTLADADAILAELRALPSPSEGTDALGDPFMLQRYYPERSEPEISKLFGTEFAGEVAGLSLGQWHGPVLSGYGVHLVYVHHREDARDPEFAAVRERVAQDWEDERRRELNDEFYTQLRARYTIVVDDEPASEDLAAVETGAR
jgi:parvulin-like peptidyl-prolyl isomerase